MKKFKIVIAALLTLGSLQGVWAIAPGGALGGGGKSSQAQPAQESKIAVEQVQDVPVLDEQTLAGAPAESPIDTDTQNSKSLNIGKQTSSEGQSAEATQDDDMRAAEVAHDSKKEMRKNFKAMLKKMRDSKGSESPSSPLDDMLVICVILALFIPPLAVYLYFGSIGTEFWISLLLTLLFFLPGVIYSLYVILTN